MAATNGRLQGVSPIYFDSATIAAFNSSTLPYGGQLGQFITKDSKKYQLVKLDSSAVTVVAGHTCTWMDQDDFVVTNDISDNVSTLNNAPAGILLSVVTAGNYCFIQVRGTHTLVVTDGGDDIAAGDFVYVDPSTDGAVDSTANGTACIYQPLGVANTADIDADNTVSVFLYPPLNGE